MSSRVAVAYTLLSLFLSSAAVQSQEEPPLFSGVYGQWHTLSDEEITALQTRWTETMVDRVLAALANKRPLQGVAGLEQMPIAVAAADMGHEKLSNEIFREIWLERNAQLDYFDLRGIPIPNCDLAEANLRFVYLQGADLSNCTFTRADFTGANLEGASLRGAKLDSATLVYAVLTNANFSEAILSGASLWRANALGANFRNASLAKANLQQANFSDISGSFLFTLVGGGELGTSFNDADLTGANLYSADLRGAVLGSASLKDANLFGAKFGDTFVDTSQIARAHNYRYIQPAGGPPSVNIPSVIAETVHREAKNFFRSQQMSEMAREYQFWENEVRTQRSPWVRRVPRLMFLKWTYGYGSRPMWLLYYTAVVVLVFGALYFLITLPRKVTSGIFAVDMKDSEETLSLLTWRKGRLLMDCLYFSLLSLATFGYGAIRPRQWLEFFRLKEVEYRPVGWARIVVGVQSALGIYLFALLATVLFGGVN